MKSARPSLTTRALRCLRERGVGYAAGRVLRLVRRRPAPAAVVPLPRPATPPAPRRSLGLAPGEEVVVRSEAEVRSTLDGAGKHRGLYFMDEMWRYCGQRFTVLKPVERIFVEATGELRTGIRDTVLLAGVQCDGSAHQECDGTCYHLWREAWLERVAAPAGERE
jgi:hypothetical protein